MPHVSVILIGWEIQNCVLSKFPSAIVIGLSTNGFQIQFSANESLSYDISGNLPDNPMQFQQFQLN